MMRRWMVALGWLLCVSVAWGGRIQPGVTITRENLDQYRQELERLMDPGTFRVVLEGVRRGLITMPVVETKAYPQWKELLAATKKYDNERTCRLGPDGELLGWRAGIPFPHPKNGRELAWNVDRRVCADQYSIPGGRLILFNARRKVERTYRWNFYSRMFTGRIMIPPMPEIPGYHGIHLKQAMLMLEPFDARGFAMLRVRYLDWRRDDDTYSYIPALRRIRRMTGRDTADPVLGSDIIYDEFEFLRQKLTPRMTFEMAERTMLVPSYHLVWEHEGRITAPIKGGCYFQTPWELRKVWVLTMNINDPNYPYGKRVIIIDQQRQTYYGYAINSYDRKGRFWHNQWYMMGIGPTGARTKDVPYIQPPAGQRYDNFLLNHCTVLPMAALIVPDPKQPMGVFTFRELLRGAR